MKFSTRTTYGLRAMVQLARNWGKGNLSLAVIAEREKISLGYLERLFARLKEAGVVKSEKGANGGYILSKNPEQILVYDIIRPLEGNMAPFFCLDEKGRVHCGVKRSCGASKVLSRVQTAINTTLKSMTLRDLL